LQKFYTLFRVAARDFANGLNVQASTVRLSWPQAAASRHFQNRSPRRLAIPFFAERSRLFLTRAASRSEDLAA
jgi:hypothetical protein